MTRPSRVLRVPAPTALPTVEVGATGVSVETPVVHDACVPTSSKGGPRTLAGKAAVSMNAIRHGMTSEARVVPGESAQDAEAHWVGVWESLAPQGHLEEELCDRVAGLTWRLRRVERYEVGLICSRSDASRYDATRPKLRRTWHLPNGAEIIKITRYEAHLHRLLVQTLHELEALQGTRAGQPVPLARLDISCEPSTEIAKQTDIRSSD
jgi:hypothetical protein